MKKQCKRKHHRQLAPTMVAMFLNPEISIQERMAVQALRGGWASTDTFNLLADARDLQPANARINQSLAFASWRALL